MEKHKAIPQGYMAVGEVANKMDVTVRTLQHYDREGLLSPSSISKGGRRLYTDKYIAKLYQILSLKHPGFSLDDIKNRIIPLETPAEIAGVLPIELLPKIFEAFYHICFYMQYFIAQSRRIESYQGTETHWLPPPDLFTSDLHYKSNFINIDVLIGLLL